MKIKLKVLNKKEVIIKTIISAALMLLMFVSFFFANTLELKLGLMGTYTKNQVSAEKLDDAKYKVTYIDVGQGNCTLIELPDGKTALIDGGNAMYGVKIYNILHSKNIDTIDILIATHADADHIGGLNYLFPRLEIKTIYRPFQISGTGSNAESFVPSASEDLAKTWEILGAQKKNKISRITSSLYAEFIDNIYKETYTQGESTLTSTVTVFYDGLSIIGDGYSFKFYAPAQRITTVNYQTTLINLQDTKYSNRTYGYATEGFGADNSNDNSAIFIFSCGGQKFLFTGDAAFEKDNINSAEFALISGLSDADKAEISNVSVYLAGHHGSAQSSSKELLSIVQPRFVVVSVGAVNDFGHPSPATLARIYDTNNLEPDFLLCTDECGTIVFAGIQDSLSFVIENEENRMQRTMSYELFACIVTAFLIMVVWAIRFKSKTQENSK